MLSRRNVRTRIQQAIGPHEDLTIEKETQTAVVWSCLPLIKSGQNHLVRHSESRTKTRQRKRLEDNIREWTGLEFAKSKRAVENRETIGKTGCEIICGAATTLAVN